MDESKPDIPDDQALAYIVHPDLKHVPQLRDTDALVAEAQGLAAAIELHVLKARSVSVSKIQAGSFLGKGQRQDIAKDVKKLQPDIVIFNYTLSPVQQRNLEREWDVKVIDRTGLILEIFGARAQTREGRLQVELAAMDYQRSRLVRSWTHLERQRGGAGFMGGPGETQIELDRRMISVRINKLKSELEDVRRTRELGRKSRERVPFPVVALVGYTNAGKSTLFNTITDADIFAEDLLFATLDPTMRRIELPNTQQAILSDTVGFISDLPTHLVAAFRATLEQTRYADVIAHIIDVSSPDYEAQKKDVIEILEELGIEYRKDIRVIEVYNKIDVLDPDARIALERKIEASDNMSAVSALNNQGVDEFLQRCVEIIARNRLEACFEIKFTDGQALSWLYDHAEIIERKELSEGTQIRVMIEPADLERFEDRYGYAP